MMNRKGFTLIELLIVVVIIGILAAIAIPKFANTKEKAYLTAMKSDLRNMVTAQEAHFSDFLVYAGAIGATQSSGVAAFVPSAGVSLTVTANAGLGWNATAAHTGTTKTCAIFGGAGPAVAPAVNEGEPRCTT